MLLSLVFCLLTIASLINCQPPSTQIASLVRNGSNTIKSAERKVSECYTRQRRGPNIRPRRPLPKDAQHTKAKECGEIRAHLLAARYVGRIEAQRGEFPWQVALLQKESGGFKYHCGGAILNEQWIITTSYCLDDLKPDDLNVAVRTHDITKINETDTFSVDKIIQHDNYHKASEGEVLNDIGLLHISLPIDLKRSDYINSVCLPEQGQKFVRGLKVSGWGQANDTGSAGRKLRMVDIFVRKDDVCQNSLKGLFRRNEMLCAIRRSSCEKEDAGSPIVKLSTEYKATLVGLVSYELGCERRGEPGVYTRVAHYVNWIKEHIKGTINKIE